LEIQAHETVASGDKAICGANLDQGQERRPIIQVATVMAPSEMKILLQLGQPEAIASVYLHEQQ
jgi:hypothetical protein